MIFDSKHPVVWRAAGRSRVGVARPAGPACPVATLRSEVQRQSNSAVRAWVGLFARLGLVELAAIPTNEDVCRMAAVFRNQVVWEQIDRLGALSAVQCF